MYILNYGKKLMKLSKSNVFILYIAPVWQEMKKQMNWGDVLINLSILESSSLSKTKTFIVSLSYVLFESIYLDPVVLLKLYLYLYLCHKYIANL